jgi:hypothetical protein
MRAPIFLAFAALLLLTGCVTREQADAKLARACAAAAELFLDEGFTIKEIKDRLYGDVKDLGHGYRRVTLKALESDSWFEVDKDYECIFVESFGFANISHRATIYQVKVNEQTYGKEGDKILGDMKIHLKLMEAVDRALMGQ